MREIDGAEEIKGDNESPGAISRRDWATTLLGALGVATLAGCVGEDGEGSPGTGAADDLASLAQAATGTSVLWVDAIGLKNSTNASDLYGVAGGGAYLCAIARGYWSQGDGGGGLFVWTTPAETDNGGTIIKSDAWSGCWKRVYSGPISVKWFGARGDGNPDTDAIRAAVAAGTGGTVHFPRTQSHYLTNQINVPANTTIQGDGLGSIVRMIDDGSSYDCSAFDVSNVERVTIRDLRIECIATTGVGMWADRAGVKIYQSHRCLVEDVEFVGMTCNGVLIHGELNPTALQANHNIVRGCRFRSWAGSASASTTMRDSADVCIKGHANYNLVKDCEVMGGGDIGIFVRGCPDDPSTPLILEGARPTGNEITGNVVGKHWAYGIAVYVVGQYNTQTIVSNNNVSDIVGAPEINGGKSGAGIYIQSAGGTVVAGNQVRNCCTATENFTSLAPAGIGLTGIQTGWPVVVSQNVVTDMPRGPGIQATTCGLGVLITGNVIKVDSGHDFGDCILLTNASRSTVTGNDLEQGSSARNGINIRSTDGAGVFYTTVTGNSIRSSGYGIAFNPTGTGFFKTIIANNSVDCGMIGLLLNGAANTVINGNVLHATNDRPLQVANSPATRITNTMMFGENPSKPPYYIDSSNPGLYLDEASLIDMG